MNKKDRDNFVALMVFYGLIDNWREETESTLIPKDKTKLKIIEETIMQLLTAYKKRDGGVSMDSIIDSSKNYDFAILPKGNKTELSNTFEADILYTCLKKIVAKNNYCVGCDRKDHENCEWLAINQYIQKPKSINLVGRCPYAVRFEDFMF